MRDVGVLNGPLVVEIATRFLVDEVNWGGTVFRGRCTAYGKVFH